MKPARQTRPPSRKQAVPAPPHQAGTLIDNELNVRPGTPLNMEVYLDSESSSVYGLMVTGMEVTDTKTQNEPILVNG